MRRCFNVDYPKREETKGGVVVRIVTLPPVKCGAVPTLRQSITWANGKRQHTYTCEEHADKLRTMHEDAGFVWGPKPYASGRG